MNNPLRLAFALPFAALILLGCGGHDSDPGCMVTAPNDPVAAYVGTYAATFTPKSAGEGSLALTFAIDADGKVTGTAHDPSIVPEVDYAVTGSSVAISGCGYASQLFLDYSPANGRPEEIVEAQKQADTLVGSHSAGRNGGEANGQAGTLTISRASP